MANVYVEARPKGRPEGSPIQDEALSKIMWSKTTPTTSSAPSPRNTRQ